MGFYTPEGLDPIRYVVPLMGLTKVGFGLKWRYERRNGLAFQIFLSHSVHPRELAFVYAVAEEAVSKGAITLISDRTWEPDNQVPARISKQIKEADYVLVIATAQGKQVRWVNKELVYAANIKKPLFIIADKEANLAPKTRMITIDRNNPTKTIREISAQIEQVRTTKENKELLTWLGVGGLLLLLLWASKE